MSTKQPILDIGGIAPDRPVIRIRTTNNPDGTLHELRVSTELSPQDYADIQRMSENVEKIDGESMDPAEIELLGQYLDDILRIAIAPITPLTDDERAELNTAQKADIVGAFTVHCLNGGEPTVQPNREARRTTAKKRKSTGAK